MEVDIVERTIEYSARIVKLFKALQKDIAGRALARQILNSGTSIGANINEAQAAESTADFIHKNHIAYKEARETYYWLRVLLKSDVVSDKILNDLKDETEQLVKILSTIIKNTKKNRDNKK